MRQARPSGALRAHTNPTRIAPNLPPEEDPAGGQMTFSNEIRRGRRKSKERTRMVQASAGKSSILQQKTHGFVIEPYRTGGFLRKTKQNKKERKKIVANGRMKIQTLEQATRESAEHPYARRIRNKKRQRNPQEPDEPCEPRRTKPVGGRGLTEDRQTENQALVRADRHGGGERLVGNRDRGTIARVCGSNAEARARGGSIHESGPFYSDDDG